MLTQDDLKIAIIMMKRASCTGEESASVATVILKLEAWYNSLQTPATPLLPAPEEDAVEECVDDVKPEADEPEDEE